MMENHPMSEIADLAAEAFAKREYVKMLGAMNVPVDYETRKKQAVEYEVAKNEAMKAEAALREVNPYQPTGQAPIDLFTCLFGPVVGA
jgi:hypothetical protein